MVFPSILFLLTAAAAAQQMPEPTYCFGFLKSAPNRPTLEKAEAQRIQAAHLAHLTALGKQGFLRAAGPIADAKTLRGILISKCKSVEEANEKSSADPAVKAGLLEVESYRWAGPPGIGDEYFRIRETNPEAPMKMAKHTLVLVYNAGDWKITSPKALRQHLANVEALRKEGKFAAGGPVTDSRDFLGPLIFRNMTMDEARKFVQDDPIFGQGVRLEVMEWWVAEDVLPR